MGNSLGVETLCETSTPLTYSTLNVLGGFLRNSRKYGLGSHRKTPTVGTPPIDLGP